MRMRTLGRTGVQVSEIGLGGIPMVRVEDLDLTDAIINRALDSGINYLDNARAYQDSEMKYGRVLKYRRKEAFVATKTTARDRDGALRDLEESLKQLQTDSVDLWQLHDLSTEQRWADSMGPGGALEAAHEAQEQGLVRFIGMSGHNNQYLLEAIKSGEFDSVLCVYNLAIHSTGDEVFPRAAEAKVGVAIMKPLSGGVFFRRPEIEIPPQRAWHFVLQRPEVSVALAGANCLRDIDQAVAASESFSPLTNAESAELIEKAGFLGEDICRNCGYCRRDCPQDLDLPQMMRIADEFRKFGYEWPRLQREYAALSPQADVCVECKSCETNCPFDLPIVERIHKLHERLSRIR
jgi:predicted aldo/keto reductase-like oxidoreductase